MIVLVECFLLVLVYLEYRINKTAITPVVILGGIYLMFIPMVNTIGVALGFRPLTDFCMAMFALFVFIVFLSGLLVGTFFGKNRNSVTYSIEERIVLKRDFIWLIFCIALVAYIISFVQVVGVYGINNTKSRAYGIFAHIGFISRCLLPVIVYYFVKFRKPKYIVGATINILVLIMFQGKYHLFIAIAATVAMFLVVYKQIKIGTIIKVVIIVFIIGMLLFASVYTIIPNILNGDTSFESMSVGLKFSFEHFFHYLFCPFISSNEYFEHPLYAGMENGLRTLLNPLDRLWQLVSGGGDYFDPVITLWPIINESGATGNVGGIFSESVLNVGYPIAIIYVFLIGIVSYYFIMQTLKKGKRIVTSLTLIGTIMMCFFCNYFTLLPNFECFVYSYLIDVLIIDNRLKFGGKVLIKEHRAR